MLDKKQELITKLAKIGYEAPADKKQSIFRAIAAVYSSDEFAILIDQYIDTVIKGEAQWDETLVNKISNV